MKKITFTAFTGIATVIALGAMLYALPALAATTASISPTNVKVVAGQQFNVVVAVNPNGTSNYAEQLQINYPANLLQVSAFNIGSGWMALTQTGYDSVDNVNGVLIKTAGYPSGITSLTPFGTITFTAEKSGNGTITIGSRSQAFQKSSQSSIVGTGASFVIMATTPGVLVHHNTAGVTTGTTSNLTPVSTINGVVVASSTNNPLYKNQTAAGANSISSSMSSMTILWIVIGILIIVIIALLVSKKNKRSL
jgi:hypothetical protein